MEFVIDCEPPKHTAQGSNRILKTKDGRLFVGKSASSKAKQTKNYLLWILKTHRPEAPYSEPIALSVDWAYPFRKTEPKKNRIKDIPCGTRPDADNLCKLLFDVMTELKYWVDDSLISELHFRKFWTAKPHIRIKIEKL